MTALHIWSWILIGGFVVALAVVGVIGTRRTKSMDDFAAARKGYPWWMVALAMTGSWCTAAAFMGQPGMAYGAGFPGLWGVMGFWLSAFFWAVSMGGIWKVGQAVGAKTIPELLGVRYDSRYIRVITALTILMNVYYVAGQYVGIGWLFNTFLGVPYLAGATAAALIMGTLIAFGGTHSGLMADAMQTAVALAVALLVLGAALVGVPGSVAGINARLVAQNPALGAQNVFSSVVPLFYPFSALSLAIGIGFGGLGPQVSKYILALRDKREAVKCAIGGVVTLTAMACMAWGGLAARALWGAELIKTPDRAIPTLVARLFPAPVAALAAVGLFAAIITQGGLYTIMANAVSYDLYGGFVGRRVASERERAGLDRNMLLINRVLVFAATVVALLLAAHPPKYLTPLLAMGWGSSTVVIVPPLVLGSVWWRVTREAATVSMTVSLALYLYLLWIAKWATFKAIGAGMIVSWSLLLLVTALTKPLPRQYLEEISTVKEVGS